jgi:2-dehydro-3-deoxyphosphooctonate aldolase (KDO 8-P synthase)
MEESKHIKIGEFSVGNDLPITLIAGPCQMESREHALEMAEALTTIAQALNINLIYKTSFDKANRTSLKSKRGIGLARAMPIFDEIREVFGCPVLTDVHTEEQCQIVARHVNVMQIPAFLSRQTDLLIAAAQSGCIINIKKAQFMAPWDINNAIKKVEDSGNNKILLTERGVSFGYNNLVTDMRSLAIMAETGYPVIFDATHSVQKPGGLGGESGGERKFVPIMARAAVAVGVAGIFMETHQDPDNAPSDGPSMVHLKDMPMLISDLIKIDSTVKESLMYSK